MGLPSKDPPLEEGREAQSTGGFGRNQIDVKPLPWIIKVWTEDPFSIMGGKWLAACEEDEHNEIPLKTLRFGSKVEADAAIRLYFPDHYTEKILHGVEAIKAVYEPLDRHALN